ncbi:tape measure protein [Xanthomonas campestris]|uniref:tape measure protein n=1 Tax=Xanthomonas campestris TaxID=339 RepID=UPI001E5A2B5C|nr:tape measure protein [Xanthomonas campestris]MCC8686241.1 tape measure protein [Xanthomonas campestris]MCW2000173.1 tape measure domain-containing protein [Xanthomonas campestris]MEA9679787.1 tape measure protein [Xanthomonas campestris pv. raphani]MEA9699171.1 tape measure protein [Xanthomonas campestris pv. raphani]MEA9780658.1 tape measure protein [Xanthomonas campestris pv. raphani]
MSNPTVTLRLTADNSKLVPAVRASKTEVEGLGKAALTTGQQAERGSQGVAGIGTAADQASRKVGTMTSAVNASKAAIAGYVGLQGARALVSMSDQYTNISGRLKLATSGQQAFVTGQAEVFAISQRTSTLLESTATLYGRLAQATAEYGLTQQRQLALTQTINRTFAISGASADAASNTIIQFTQALAGGVLRAEEFNSVIENSPRLAKALADGLGVGMGQLRKMVNDGGISVDQLVKALEGQAGAIEKEFNTIPLTVERAMVQLRNSVTRFVGEGSRDLGAGSALAESIAFLANNLDGLDEIVGVVAVAFGGRLLGNLAQASAAKLMAAAASRQLAQAELVAARAAEAQAVGQLSLARAGVTAAGSTVAAEQALAAAQLRTATAAQAASVALTAKAAAMRGLNTAMAAFGGPVGLAITALTLFVMWVANSRQKAEELSKAVTAGFQASIETLKGFNKETANTSFANLSSSIETLSKANQELDVAQEKYQDLISARETWLARTGALPPGFNEELQVAAERLETTRLRQQQLSTGYDDAIDVTANLVLQYAGITNATDKQRESLEELIKRQSSQGLTLEQNKPLFISWARTQADVTAANNLTAASFQNLVPAAQAAGAAVSAAGADIVAGLDKQIRQLELQRIEDVQGKGARVRVEVGMELADAGAKPNSQNAQDARERAERVAAMLDEQEARKKAATVATAADQKAKQAAEELVRTRKQQADSQTKYSAQAAELAAALNGPLAAAEEQHRQRVLELDRELTKHNITQEAYNTLVNTSVASLSAAAAEMAREQQAPQALLDSMTGEIALLGKTGLARERATRQLRNEHDMRQAINDANKAGAGINAEMTENLVEQARAYADLSLQIERQTENLQEWADVATRGVADFSDLLADAFSGGVDSSKDFFDQLKDVFQRGWRDLVRTMLEQDFVRPFQQLITNAIGGAFSNSGSSSGGWMTQLAGMVGGGQGLTGTNAMAANSNWGNAITAGAGSLMGFGNNVGGNAAGGGFDMGTLQALYGGGGGVSAAAMPWMSAVGGALYGYKNAGSGGLSSAAAGVSYGTLGYVGSSLAVGALSGAGAATAATAGAGLYATGSAAAGGAAAGAAGAAAAIPVVGWIVAALALIDMVSGGKLFGTKFKAKEITSTLGVTETGGYAGAELLEERQKALFGGRKQRVRAVDPGDGAKQAAADLYAAIHETAEQAADALGLASVDIIEGSFTRVTNAKGQLKREFSTILGAVYSETAEEFSQRLNAENIIGQIAQVDELASGIAQRWRGSAATLEEGAQFLLAAATDFSNGSGLLTTGGLARLTDLVELLGRGDETLSQTYQRIMSGAQAYAATAATAYQEVATQGFSEFAKQRLAIAQEEQQRIKALQDQAKALHGLSAREEDLAAVRQAAQLKTDTLVQSLQAELVDLALNRINDQIEQLGGSADGAGSKIEDFIKSLSLSATLSPNTDTQKRATADDLMRSAAAAGNVDSFTQYAQQFLEISRNLNASSAGYQTDYAQVLELAKRFGADGSDGSLQQLYTQRAALQAQQEAAARMERAQRIAQGVSDLAGVNGSDPFQILRNVTGMSPEMLAGDLGLSLPELSDYLTTQQTDIADLADILEDLPERIAQAMVTVLADREVPSYFSSGSNSGSATPTNTPSTASPNAEGIQVFAEIRDGINLLVRRGTIAELQAL